MFRSEPGGLLKCSLNGGKGPLLLLVVYLCLFMGVQCQGGAIGCSVDLHKKVNLQWHFNSLTSTQFYAILWLSMVVSAMDCNGRYTGNKY